MCQLLSVNNCTNVVTQLLAQHSPLDSENHSPESMEASQNVFFECWLPTILATWLPKCG